MFGRKKPEPAPAPLAPPLALAAPALVFPPDAVVDPSAVIEPSPMARLNHPEEQNPRLGSGVKIGAGARVESSALPNGSSLGVGARLIVDNPETAKRLVSVTLGDHCLLHLESLVSCDLVIEMAGNEDAKDRLVRLSHVYRPPGEGVLRLVVGKGAYAEGLLISRGAPGTLTIGQGAHLFANVTIGQNILPGQVAEPGLTIGPAPDTRIVPLNAVSGAVITAESITSWGGASEHESVFLDAWMLCREAARQKTTTLATHQALLEKFERLEQPLLDLLKVTAESSPVDREILERLNGVEEAILSRERQLGEVLEVIDENLKALTLVIRERQERQEPPTPSQMVELAHLRQQRDQALAALSGAHDRVEDIGVRGGPKLKAWRRRNSDAQQALTTPPGGHA
jgi:hypothetical protein